LSGDAHDGAGVSRQTDFVPVRSMVHPNSYFDSVVLMRVAAEVGSRPGVRIASLIMGTEANQQVLAEASLLTDEGRAAGPNDLVIAVDGDDSAVDEALAAAQDALRDRSAASGTTGGETAPIRPRTIARAADGANLALISTPGRYAAAEAMKALRLGLHVFLFSDNVPLEHEVALKQYARARGLLVMGPDCGTAILNGAPLGFANEVRRGRIGLIGASGTGLQQVSSLIDAWGAGVSQVIGVGSRDLYEEVGAVSMLTALDALAADPGTDVIVLISKPPAASVAELVLKRAAGTGKPVVVNFLGASLERPEGAAEMAVVPTLEEAAKEAVRLASGRQVDTEPVRGVDAADRMSEVGRGRWLLRALLAGGTFAYEANLLLEPRLGEIAGSVDRYVPGTPPALPEQHLVLDLGDDEFTVGRPHPMIDPTARLEFISAAAEDPTTAVILLDVVLGYGAAPDPAGDLAPAVAEATGRSHGPVVVAFVVGTAGDSQGLAAQKQKLADAGAVLAESSTHAALLVAELLTTAKLGAAS